MSIILKGRYIGYIEEKRIRENVGEGCIAKRGNSKKQRLMGYSLWVPSKEG